MYDEKIAKAFFDNQLKLYPEQVAGDIEEAMDFLIDTCAAVADSADEVVEYLEEVGVDTEGLSKKEILDLPEVFAVGDGRFLICEI